MLVAGAISGPLLDGIHGTVDLLTYDVAPINVGSFHTSATVPVLLSLFYAIIGCTHVLADALAVHGSETHANGRATVQVQQRAGDGAWVALSAGGVAGLLALSAVLYAQHTDYPVVGGSVLGYCFCC